MEELTNACAQLCRIPSFSPSEREAAESFMAEEKRPQTAPAETETSTQSRRPHSRGLSPKKDQRTPLERLDDALLEAAGLRTRFEDMWLKRLKDYPGWQGKVGPTTPGAYGRFGDMSHGGGANINMVLQHIQDIGKHTQELVEQSVSGGPKPARQSLVDLRKSGGAALKRRTGPQGAPVSSWNWYLLSECKKEQKYSGPPPSHGVIKPVSIRQSTLSPPPSREAPWGPHVPGSSSKRSSSIGLGATSPTGDDKGAGIRGGVAQQPDSRPGTSPGMPRAKSPPGGARRSSKQEGAKKEDEKRALELKSMKAKALVKEAKIREQERKQEKK